MSSDNTEMDIYKCEDILCVLWEAVKLVITGVIIVGGAALTFIVTVLIPLCTAAIVIYYIVVYILRGINKISHLLGGGDFIPVVAEEDGELKPLHEYV
mgnify:CR=1 FL=1|tara:strand:- start:106 stop:399 length:294 start_codon:yes stop_codon:yes gene_type:complete